MLTDLNKNISSTIRYNHLNLPVEIVFDNTNKISYVYDAEGRKLEKNILNGTVTTTTKYMNGFQYLNAVLQFFPTAEGYVKKTGNAYFYVFNYTDHLGNIRMSYSDNNNDGMISPAPARILSRGNCKREKYISVINYAGERKFRK